VSNSPENSGNLLELFLLLEILEIYWKPPLHSLLINGQEIIIECETLSCFVLIKSTVHLFADYTMAYLTMKSDQDARQFQKDLHKLTEWEKTWMMEIHPENHQETMPYPTSLHTARPPTQRL